MKTPIGGTAMWCPKCGKVRVCASPSLSSIGRRSGQRRRKAHHEDIHLFRRARVCSSCGHQFTTAEIDETLLAELIVLRTALRTVKRDAKILTRQFKILTNSLNSLLMSLDSLRPVDIYKPVKPTKAYQDNAFR